MAARVTLGIAAAAASLLISASARAQAAPEVQQARGFGEQYPFVVSVENVGGVLHQRFEFEGSDPDSFTNIGVFTSYFPFITPQQKVGLHYFVAAPLSLGLGLHYSDNDELGETVLLAPRVGVALPFSSGAAVWLRAGITYFDSSSGFLSGDLSDIWAGGEVFFVLQPVEHFGFLIGPTFEYGLNGKQTVREFISGPSGPDTLERDYEFMQFGVTFGVLADF
jgi:hypothetical protein